MAKAQEEHQSSHRRQNRFLVMLLVGAALVSAAKDLGRLHDLTSGLVGLASSLHHRVNAAVESPAAPSCPLTLAENDRSGQPYNWNGRVAPDQLVEMKNSNGGIDAVPAVAGDLELVAIKRASCVEPATQPIKIAHATEVATWVLHKQDSSDRRNAGRNRSANQIATMRVFKDDLRLNVIVRAPAEAELVSSMINDEIINDQINATWLAGNTLDIGVCPVEIPRIDSQVLNGRIEVATGNAQARILSREINARVSVPNCSEVIEIKTAGGTISLDLLKILRARLAAETRNDETVSDFPRTLKGLIQRTLPAVPAPAEDSH